MDIYVKQASLEDSKKVAQLFDAYRVFYQQKSDIDLAVDFISERIKNQESVIFTALDHKGNYLGFTQLYPSFSSVSAQRTWVLNDLFVANSARNLGVGRMLMNAAKNFALDTKAKSIALSTAMNNTNAQALYESLGYQKDNDYYHYALNL